MVGHGLRRIGLCHRAIPGKQTGANAQVVRTHDLTAVVVAVLGVLRDGQM